MQYFNGRFGDLRSTLDLDGTNSLETLLHQVTGLSKQVHPAALEVLEFIKTNLERKAIISINFLKCTFTLV